MEKEQIREVIARRVAMELKDGDVVNLGIGLPTLVPNYLPEGVKVILQTENGLIGMGPTPEAGMEDPDLVNAGGRGLPVLTVRLPLESYAVAMWMSVSWGHCRWMRKVTLPIG